MIIITFLMSTNTTLKAVFHTEHTEHTHTHKVCVSMSNGIRMRTSKRAQTQACVGAVCGINESHEAESVSRVRNTCVGATHVGPARDSAAITFTETSRRPCLKSVPSGLHYSAPLSVLPLKELQHNTVRTSRGASALRADIPASLAAH